jgi:acyl-coenzyme A synthetase/AMP-(fatty) acid ligase
LLIASAERIEVISYLVGRYWETVERLRIHHFYGAPTALRLLIK